MERDFLIHYLLSSWLAAHSARQQKVNSNPFMPASKKEQFPPVAFHNTLIHFDNYYDHMQFKYWNEFCSLCDIIGIWSISLQHALLLSSDLWITLQLSALLFAAPRYRKKPRLLIKKHVHRIFPKWKIFQEKIAPQCYWFLL